MTSKPVMYELYKAVEYLTKAGIAGDFVECGVWKGGSSILSALTAERYGRQNIKLWLYDTFEGMTSPSRIDVDLN